MAGERTFVVKFVSDTKDAIKGVTQMNNAFARFSSNVEGRAVAALKGLIPSFKQIAVAGVAGLGAAGAAFALPETHGYLPFDVWPVTLAQTFPLLMRLIWLASHPKSAAISLCGRGSEYIWRTSSLEKRWFGLFSPSRG